MTVLPEGAARVSATIYQWDPKNDLAAFIANQKSAWNASGFTILVEEPLILELGLATTEFTLQTPDAKVIYLVTAIGDQYLVLSGEGNLELMKEIVQRVRPISPHTKRGIHSLCRASLWEQTLECQRQEPLDS